MKRERTPSTRQSETHRDIVHTRSSSLISPRALTANFHGKCAVQSLVSSWLLCHQLTFAASTRPLTDRDLLISQNFMFVEEEGAPAWFCAYNHDLKDPRVEERPGFVRMSILNQGMVAAPISAPAADKEDSATTRINCRFRLRRDVTLIARRKKKLTRRRSHARPSVCSRPHPWNRDGEHQLWRPRSVVFRATLPHGIDGIVRPADLKKLQTSATNTHKTPPPISSPRILTMETIASLKEIAFTESDQAKRSTRARSDQSRLEDEVDHFKELLAEAESRVKSGENKLAEALQCSTQLEAENAKLRRRLARRGGGGREGGGGDDGGGDADESDESESEEEKEDVE